MGSKSAEAPLIVIVGETASGKTAAGIKIAQKVGGEIICADSRTIYKQMDIGTAKPSRAEQHGVPHHLLDVIEPSETFSVAQFQRRANKCIQEIIDRGKVPIIVGGTGLYVDSVLYNFQFNSKADQQYRILLEQMNDEELTTLLHTKNINLDKLNTKNRRHVIRAIERDGALAVKQELRKNTIILGMKLEREVLKSRVSDRVEQMFQSGFLKEANGLFERFGDVEALRTPGYKAARAYFLGEIDKAETKARFIKADLQLAKRQRTWFKRNKSIKWFTDQDPLITEAVNFVKSGSVL